MDAIFNRVVTVTAEGSLRVKLVQPNVVCVAYTNKYSVGHKSVQDLHIGITAKTVASNQDVLDRTPDGSYVIVTCQDDRGRPNSKCVIGRLGGHRGPAVMWKEFARTTRQTGGHVWSFAREFTPLTPVLSVAALRKEFDIPRNLFNSRLCGYGHPPAAPSYAPLVQQIVDRHSLA